MPLEGRPLEERAVLGREADGCFGSVRVLCGVHDAPHRRLDPPAWECNLESKFENTYSDPLLLPTTVARSPTHRHANG